MPHSLNHLPHVSCCRDPQVRGGKCENCDTWVSEDKPQAQQPKGPDSDDPGSFTSLPVACDDVTTKLSEAYHEACDRRDYRVCDALRGLIRQNLQDNPQGTVMPLRAWVKIEVGLGYPEVV